VQVCPVNCKPVDPEHVETNATLWAKYRVLQLAAVKPAGEGVVADPGTLPAR
jgi:hypothetical protein